MTAPEPTDADGPRTPEGGEPPAGSGSGSGRLEPEPGAEPGPGLEDSRAAPRSNESRRAAARARREAAREAFEAEKRAEAERRAAAAALAASQPAAQPPAAARTAGPGPATRAAWARAALNPGPWPWAALALTGLALFAAFSVGRERDAREAVEAQLAEQQAQQRAAAKAASEREVELAYQLDLARTHGNALASNKEWLDQRLAALERDKADVTKALGQAEAARDAAALERDSRMAGLAKLEAQLAEVASRALVERASLAEQLAATKAEAEASDRLLAATRQQIAELEGTQVELEAEKEELEAEAAQALVVSEQLALLRADLAARRTLEAEERGLVLQPSPQRATADRPLALSLSPDDLALLERAGRGETLLRIFVAARGELAATLVAGEQSWPLTGARQGGLVSFLVAPGAAAELAAATGERRLRLAPTAGEAQVSLVELRAVRLPPDLVEQLQRARAPEPEQPPGERGF